MTNLTEAVDAEKENTGVHNVSELQDEDIDLTFDVAVNTASADSNVTEAGQTVNGKTNIKDLELSIRKLRARITIYQKNENELVTELEELQKQSGDKESQCKKLIAACCGVPIEKVDSLLHPLIQAIESDPPDLDLSRVAGFMAKIQNHDDKGDLVLKGSQSADTMNDDSD
jgi:regulatory protein SWI6